MRVVDWSNYQWDNEHVLLPHIADNEQRYRAEREVVRGYFKAMKAAGIQGIIVGRQRRNIWAGAMRELGLEEGIEPIGDYLMNVGGQWPSVWPETVFRAIDVEPHSEFDNEQEIDNAILHVQSIDKVPVLYGAEWAWLALNLNHITKWKEQGIAFWNAKYDGKADGFHLAKVVGGYDTCVIDQFTEQGMVPGVPFPMDMNEIDDNWLASIRPATPPPAAPVVVTPGLPVIPIRAQLDTIRGSVDEINRLLS